MRRGARDAIGQHDPDQLGQSGRAVSGASIAVASEGTMLANG